MLVLSRKKCESIMIGDDIEIKIISIDGEQVKIGIVAPKTVKVHRSEIFEAIQQQNEEALQLNIELFKNFKKNKENY